MGNIIASDFKMVGDFTIGHNCIIEKRVQVGLGVTLKHRVELRENTVIGDDCYLDSVVISSGDCVIGSHVTIRYNSIIAKGTQIMDDVFISPQLMTENLDHFGKPQGGAKIGEGIWNRENAYRVFIGTNVVLAAGITICPDVIIGSKANVRKSITEPGVYIGNPARKVR